MVKEFNKSLSNTSTASIESGIFDIDEPSIDTTAVLGLNIGEVVTEILLEAQMENRVICGLNSASKYLKETENPEHSLFFFIAPSIAGDSLTHIQEVVLQAFCFESDIYIIKVDNADKLNSILGTKRSDTCALVQRSAIKDLNNNDDEIDLGSFSTLEGVLIDHCEEFWSEPIQPIIKLPEK